MKDRINKTSEAIQAIVWKETNFLLGKSAIVKHRGKERESVKKNLEPKGPTLWTETKTRTRRWKSFWLS